MERRATRNPHPISNGRHVKQRKLRMQMSYKTLRRLVIALYMCTSALAGAILQLAIDNGWIF